VVPRSWQTAGPITLASDTHMIGHQPSDIITGCHAAIPNDSDDDNRQCPTTGNQPLNHCRALAIAGPELRNGGN